MLSIFRLHGPRCSGKKPKHDRTYRRCSCPIHVEGKCGDRFLRKSLHTSTWQRAQKQVAEAEARGSWDPLPEEVPAQLITIVEAKERFLKDAESGRRLGESTLRKYRLMLRHLEEFAAKQGFLHLKQLDGEALREFRDSWKLSPRTALKKLERGCATSKWRLGDLLFLIGIGGSLAAPPLPHHRTCGSASGGSAG